MRERDLPKDRDMLSHDALLDLGIVVDGETVARSELIYDSGMRAESWNYAYRLTIQNESGEEYSREIFQRNIISMGGDLSYKAQQFYEKLQALERNGIPTIPTFGVRGGTIYQEKISNGMHLAIKNIEELGTEAPEFGQLVDMCARLDHVGFTSMNNFFGDAIFDRNRNMFMFVDVGWDSGAVGGRNGIQYHNDLINKFPHLEDEITEVYQTTRDALDMQRAA